MKEEWKDVVGYENLFSVSNWGKVYSKRTNKVLKQHTNDKGYKTIGTKIGGRKGKCILLRVHKLVADAFISNPLNKPYVNHKNGIKIDNIVENLEWVTSKENIVHAFRTGLMNPVCGENHVKSKSTQKQVEDIRLLDGKLSHRKIGKIYGLHHSTVQSMLNMETWK